MKRLCAQLLGCLAIIVLLPACEPPAVQVSFAQPFPVGTAAASAFARADQGQYQDATDTSSTLLVGPSWLLTRRFITDTVRTAQLDSLGLLRRAGPGQDHQGHQYQVRPLRNGCFALRREERDTIASLLGPARKQVRRYRGWYYLNTPAAGQWQVERVGLVGRRLYRQYFNPDSLRIKALQPQMVQLTRDGQQLSFTLHPQPGRQTRQINRYAGLWLTLGEYVPKKQP